MTQLTNADEWWTEAAAINDDVKGYVGNIAVERILSSPHASAVFGKRGIELLEENRDSNIWDVIDKALAARDVRLYNIYHSIWDDAPDSPSIHSWPNWHRFCDLLSEGPDCLFRKDPA